MVSDSARVIAPSIGSIRVPCSRLAALISELMHATGLPLAAAQTVAAALVDADRAGLPSHGVMLVPLYVERLRGGSVSQKLTGNITNDRGSAIVIDAQDALGQLTSQQAVDLLIERAPLHGLAAVAVRNGFHFGAAGYWTVLMARAGLVGIAMCNTRPLMPAPGGAERVVGNNPLSIALPVANSEPLVLDMAMSAGAMGKIRRAAAAGEAIPHGWATDSRGAPTTDPADAINGMLLPAGGVKGFGLALMIDLLCGGLADGAIGGAVRPLYGNDDEPYRCSHLFIGIDVAHFRDFRGFTEAVAVSIDHIRNSPLASDGGTVSIPGDRSALARLANSDSCPIAADTARALAGLAATLGIPTNGVLPQLR